MCLNEEKRAKILVWVSLVHLSSKNGTLQRLSVEFLSSFVTTQQRIGKTNK